MDGFDHGMMTSEDLLAYVDGEIDERRAAHVAGCAICSQQIAEYGARDAHLSDTLFRLDCPDPQTLGEFVVEMLSAEQTLAMRMHLADCPNCTDEIAALRGLLRGDPRAAPISRPSPLARLIARLLPAPNPQLGLAGVRGTGVQESETYIAGPVTVSISLTATSAGSARRYLLIGLVINEQDGSIPVGAPVRLMQGSALIVEEQLDESGNVAMDDLREGLYNLEVLLPTGIVVVEGISIGADTERLN
jgi:hypothetical protein